MFKFIDETEFTLCCHKLILSNCDTNNAYMAWEDKLVKEVQEVIRVLEAIYID